jgi:hypothetical protein
VRVSTFVTALDLCVCCLSFSGSTVQIPTNFIISSLISHTFFYRKRSYPHFDKSG